MADTGTLNTNATTGIGTAISPVIQVSGTWPSGSRVTIQCDGVSLVGEEYSADFSRAMNFFQGEREWSLVMASGSAGATLNYTMF